MKQNSITIDLNTWQAQKDYAKDNNVSPQVVNNWIKRGKIEFWRIEQLDLTLVKKSKSVTVEDLMPKRKQNQIHERK